VHAREPPGLRKAVEQTEAAMNEIVQPISLSTRASQPEPPALRIFISYAAEDRDIALAVGEALKGALHEDFAEINLDKWFMEAGVEFATQIRKKLEQTDIFIVIFTGMEKESHSFTGMEVGYFMRVMEGRPGRMVPLFLKAAPATMSSVHGIGIGFDSKVLNLLPEAFDAQNDVGPADPMCTFVTDLQQRVDEVRASIGYAKPVRLRPEQDPIVCIKTMRQKIFQILRKKAEISLRPQKQVLFTTTDKALIKNLPDLPADARLQPDPSGSPMSIFGLPDVDMTWESFLSSISGNEYRDSWRQAIASVISSSFPDKINVDNSQVVISADRTKSYRIILTACTKFFDDRREFSLCFVEGLRRDDFGNNDTSLLLKGLDMVCRFRFLLLEGDSEFTGNNIMLTKLDDLPDLAHRLIRELHLLDRDARDAGLHKANVWRRFVDWPSLRKMGEEYQPQEQALRGVIRKILESQDKPDDLAGLQKELASIVLGIETTMRPANALVVRSMASQLKQMVASPSRDALCVAANKGAPEAMGGYSFRTAEPYIGEYVCVRPDFKNPKNLYAYLMDISWNEDDGHLIFQEKKRKDAKFTHTGDVYLAEGSPVVNLVTIAKGKVRQIILSTIDGDGVMKGLLQTLYNPFGTAFMPVSAPFVLKKTNGHEFAMGELDETMSDYKAHRQLLEGVKKDGFGEYIGLG
jgi:TIR domain